ncbi:MAG: class I SAM-dependent methyltransferase [Coriobacteriia bacterium]|nr:class I SAM-dependent methyltransferase [Coriobacteriia bacterium]
MGFFNWAAPLFKHFADRWSEEDVDSIAEWLAPSVSAGGWLLDVGGGTGALAARLQTRLGAEIAVLDPTPEMLSHVAPHAHVHTVLGAAEGIPFPDEKFDAIIVTDAFHHFRNQNAAAQEFARVLRPNGGVVILELDSRNPAIRWIGLGEKVLGEPAAFLSPAEMQALMSAQGITGTCTPMNGSSYRFTGTTKS